MNDRVIEIKSREPGNTSIILCGVHGDEKCGVYAIKELLPTLKIDRGSLLIGFGNPRAILKNVRFTEKNLNRMFVNPSTLRRADKNSYEYKRASVLKIYLNKADALLDIHSSFTPGARPFIIAEKNASKIVKCLPFNLVISGFDDVEPGGTDYYMNKIGKVGICVECGYLGDRVATDVAKRSIHAFLAARGHIEGKPRFYQKRYRKMYKKYFAKTDRFRLAKPFKDFAVLKRGQIIGFDGSRAVRASKDSFILFARDTDRINNEAFLLGQ